MITFHDRMIRTFTFCVLSSGALSLLAQAEPHPPASPAKDEVTVDGKWGYAAPAQDAYQGAWSIPDAQQTAAVWKALCDARPADVNAQFNWFRSERNARLSSNNGRLRADDEAELSSIADRIQSTAPGSFEQHLSSYYIAFPERKAFAELEQANAAAPGREELILPMLTRANINGDKAGLDRWCSELEHRGGLVPALSAVAADLLLSVDDGAVVFTNGDMDGAPALVQQRTHDQRRDVLIVDQRLLSDAGYRQLVWSEAKAKGPVPAPGPAFARALIGATERPVFLALSLDREWFDAFQGQLCATGIAFGISTPNGCTTHALEHRWGQMKKSLTAGPLSRNYLLPGSILLQKYKADGNEKRASQLEAELRTMAGRLGAMQDLIKAGVLTH